jgi:hypothetical protein
MRMRRTETGDAVGRPSWRSSFLGAPGVKFFCGKLGTGTKKEKRSKKERNRGPVETDAAEKHLKDTITGSDPRAAPRLIVPMSLQLVIPRRVALQQSSPPLHQPSVILKEKRKFEKEKPLNGKCANSKLSQQRGSPHNCVPEASAQVNETSFPHLGEAPLRLRGHDILL